MAALVLRFSGALARPRARLVRAVAQELAHRGVPVRLEDAGPPTGEAAGSVEVRVGECDAPVVAVDGEREGLEVAAQRVLAALEAEGLLGSGPEDVYSAEEEAAVSERLRSLGYID